MRKAIRAVALSERAHGPAWSKTLCTYENLLRGNREVCGLATGSVVRIGRRRVAADDVRPAEVRLLHSSAEAGEQARRSGRGVGGAKAGGRGKHGRVLHAPDAEPGKCVPETRTCTGTSEAEEKGTVQLVTAPRGYRS